MIYSSNPAGYLSFLACVGRPFNMMCGVTQSAHLLSLEPRMCLCVTAFLHIPTHTCEKQCFTLEVRGSRLDIMRNKCRLSYYFICSSHDPDIASSDLLLLPVSMPTRIPTPPSGSYLIHLRMKQWSKRRQKLQIVIKSHAIDLLLPSSPNAYISLPCISGYVPNSISTRKTAHSSWCSSIS
jgi:hypothetical protein